MNNQRRKILAGGLGLGSAAFAASCSRGPADFEQPKSTPHPRLYDVSNPAENLEAFAKVWADLSGKPVWLAATGIIYLIRDGEMPLPLMRVSGLRYTKLERNDNGFVSYIRDWAFYRDLETDKVLTEFTNPISGAINVPHPILTSYIKWTYDAQSGQQMQGYDGDAWLIDRPFQLPWFESGDDVTVTLELLVRYASGIGGGEWIHLMTSMQELNDPNITSTSCRFVWTGHSPVMSWLDPSATKGRTLWQSNGRKYSSLESLPQFYKDEIDAVFPGSLEAPETYQKPK